MTSEKKNIFFSAITSFLFSILISFPVYANVNIQASNPDQRESSSHTHIDRNPFKYGFYFFKPYMDPTTGKVNAYLAKNRPIKYYDIHDSSHIAA